MEETVSVLLVEDSDDDAYLLTRILERIPVKVNRVTNLADALIALTSPLSEPFYIVLTDLNLPDARGLTAVHTLAQYHETILVLTGDPGYDEYEAIRQGADDFVYKGDGFSAIRKSIMLAYARSVRRMRTRRF